MQKSRASMVAVVVGMKTGEGKHRINARRHRTSTPLINYARISVTKALNSKTLPKQPI